jgi:hypothetical protein
MAMRFALAVPIAATNSFLFINQARRICASRAIRAIENPRYVRVGNDCQMPGNASEATETDGSGELENRRYLPAFVELMKASGHMFYVAFRQHISKKTTSCSSRHHAIIFDPTDQCRRVGKMVEEATECSVRGDLRS